MTCTTRGYCRRCEGYVDLPAIGDLFLWYPTQHLLSKLQAALADFSIVFHPGFDCVKVREVPGKLLKNAFSAHLNDLEMKDFKALLLEPGETPGIHNLRNIDTLYGLLQKLDNDWLIDLIGEGRLTSFFQPLVEVSQPEKVFAYEALLRGRTEHETLSAGPIIKAARDSDLVFQVDREARLSAIRKASEHNIQTRLFVNFLPTAIYDPETCLRTTEKAIRDSTLDPSQIVFEVVETERIVDPDHLINVLQYYRKSGFKVALDDLGAGFGSLNLMNTLRPDFVKLDMDLIRNVHADPFKATITKRLLQMARELEIQSVVEGIETAEEFEWVQQHGADYAQGYYFARPAATPPLVAGLALALS